MNNILLVIDSLVGAGAQRQLTNLAVGLQERGHDVTVFFYHPKYDFLEKLQNSGVNIIECHKRSRFDFSPVLELYKSVIKLEPDCMVSFLRTPSIYCEVIKMVKPNIRLIVSERSSVLNGRVTAGDMGAGLLHTIASVVNCNSRDYIEHLTKKLPFLSKKTSVIYNGIQPHYFSSRYHIDTDGSKKLPTQYAVVAARCTEFKGAMVVAKAAYSLKCRNEHNFKINWIGAVDFNSVYVKSVVAYLKKNDLESHWVWHGKSNDIISALEGQDVLISASYQEGISNVICEAMSLGLPVIVSSVSDNPYILQNGRYGALFSPGDAQELSVALATYCAYSEQQLKDWSDLAHERAIELFSMDRMISEWEDLIEA